MWTVGNAAAQFTTIASTTTINPAGTTAFTLLDQRPAIANGLVSFQASGGGPTGIFTGSGGTVTAVASAGVTDPFGGAPLATFGSTDLSGSRVAFPASPNGAPGPTGVYSATLPGGSLTGVAGASTAIPNGTGNFTGFGNPVAVSGTNFAFSGGNFNNSGIYANVGSGGSLVRIVSTTVTVPNGAGPFVGFSTPVLAGTTVAFSGQGGGRQGVYAGSGGALTVIADTGTNIPNGTGTFTSFPAAPPAISGTNIAFVAAGSSNQEGVYRSTIGGLARIADKTTTVPGGVGTFTDFDPIATIDGTSVAFLGTDSAGQKGLFLFNGTLTRVIAVNDLYENDGITALNLGPFSFENGQLAFWASINPAKQVIVRFTPVPEPSSCLALVGILALGWRTTRLRLLQRTR
jgi:hypothetical protein